MSELRTSKRRRNQVSYYEATELENDEQANIDDEDYSQTKKCKICRFKNANGNKMKTFPFLELPPELRNKIYGYCLVDPDEIVLRSKTKNFRRSIVRTDSEGVGVRKEPRQELRPAILAVCSQIYEEASPLLYGQSIHVDDTMTLHAFIACTSHRNRLLLREIVVHSWGMGRGADKAMNHPALTLLATCTNLEHVFLACQIHWGSYHRNENTIKLVARQLYRDGFHFLEAIGAARGNQDAAIDVVEIHENHYGRFPGGILAGFPDEDQKCAAMESGREAFRDELKKLLRSGRTA